MNKTDIAWAAGFMDGEGTIQITAGKPKGWQSTRYHLALRAANRDIRTLNHLVELFGGGVYYVSRLARRAVSGQWNLANRNAVEATLRQLLPYLITKREHALLGLEFLDACPSVRKRSVGLTPEIITKRRSFYNRMRVLNAKGYDYSIPQSAPIPMSGNKVIA